MKTTILTFIIILTSLTSFSQTYNYTTSWETVDSLDNKRLPVQALAKVREIRAQAEKEKNYPHIIRCLGYSMDYAKEVEGGDQEIDKAFHSELKKYIALAEKMPQAYRAITYGRIAEFYRVFLENKENTITKRTQIQINNTDEISTWGIDRLNNEIKKYFNLSIADYDTLKKINLNDYRFFCDHRPLEESSLYDFLACNYLDYLKQTKDNNYFDYGDIALLSPMEEFIELNPEERGASSNECQIMKIYQNMLRAHIDRYIEGELNLDWEEYDNERISLLTIDVNRLRHYLGKSNNKDSSEQYYKTLLKMREYYSVDMSDMEEDDIAFGMDESNVCGLIAQYLVKNGRYVEAHEFATEILKTFHDWDLEQVNE